MTGWTVEIAKLVQRSGQRLPVKRRGPVTATMTDAGVPETSEASVDLVLESVGESISATGAVQAPWEGECRRCLELVTGTVDTRVQEVFEIKPTEGETYPLETETIDLEPLVRDAILLELPVAPLCREECQGPVPEAFEQPPEGEDDTETKDPRWAALDDLDL